MPPLVCPSPLIVDHSFPRSASDLASAGLALGGLQELVEQHRILLALTPALREFVEMFDWEQPSADMALLTDVYRYCTLLFLSPSSAVIMYELTEAEDGYNHPVPVNCSDDPLVEYWARDMGRLLARHEEARGRGGRWCVGIACAEPFADEPCPGYDRPHDKAFPLVGPAELDELADALEWVVPPEVRDQPVRFADAHKHVVMLGASHVDSPSGGSHHKVHFPGSRPWVLDPNVDPLPDRFLGELSEIAGYPLPVIKYVLLRGEFPLRTLQPPPGPLVA